MPKKTMFGHKMQKKSWDSSEIDKEWEEKKIGLVLLVVVIFMIFMGLLMWWIGQTLHK